MSGFTNDIMNADNVNFSGSNPTVGQITADGQLMIGAGSAPFIRPGTLTAGTGISITNGPGSITIGLSGSGQAIDSITPNSGTSPIVPDLNGNINLVGSGSITNVGSANTGTIQLTGLTQYNVLVGAGTDTITKVAPSATSGVPLISQGASSDPTFGTAAIAGGGTNATSFSTSTGIVKYDGTSLVTSSTATIDSSNRIKNSAQPAFEAYLSPAVSNVTGDGTTYTVVFNNETFDNASNFNTTTGIFTAPVAGKYLLNVALQLTGISASHTQSLFWFNCSTLGQFFIAQYNLAAIRDSVVNNSILNHTAYLSLAASETVSLQFSVGGGAKAIGIANGLDRSRFSGFLVVS